MTQESQVAPVIQVSPTPNPLALKFITNRLLKREGKATFAKPSDAFGVRLAEDLFQVFGVRQLYFFKTSLTVTFSVDADPDQLANDIKAVLISRLAIHDPDFLTEAENAKIKKLDRSGLPDDVRQVEEILDETVRMYLQGDGGDIEVIAIKDKRVYVRYQGACGTCPSSTQATLGAIQQIVQDRFDPEAEVVPIMNEDSSEE